MRRRYNTITIVILVLIGIGILTQLITRPGAFLIPVLVLGIIFLLYKYPPHRWNKGSIFRGSQRKKYEFNHRTQRKSKLKVIKGSKRDDDETPPYH